jgi:large subunit ribosomal protein L21
MYAVVQTGGKQYLVQAGDIITVDLLEVEKDKDIELDMLATFDCDSKKVALGAPLVTGKAKATVVEHGRGEKVRSAKFKAKSRFRKVQGFRPHLTSLKIVSIS